MFENRLLINIINSVDLSDSLSYRRSLSMTYAINWVITWIQSSTGYRKD